MKNNSLLTAYRDLYAPAGYFEYKQAKEENTIKSDQSFISAFPGALYVENAQINLDQLKASKREKNWETLRKQQECTLQK